MSNFKMYSFSLKTEPLPVSCWLLPITAALWPRHSVNLILLTDPVQLSLEKQALDFSQYLFRLSLPPHSAGKSRTGSQVPPASKGNHPLCDTGGEHSIGSTSLPNSTTAQPSRTEIFSSLIPTFSL